MNESDVIAVLDVMAGSEHVRAQPDEIARLTRVEIEKMPITGEDAMAVVVPMIRERRTGDPIPQVGDFLNALRRKVRERTEVERNPDSPREWSESTRSRLSYAHEGANHRGPVGALRELIHAGGINESRMCRYLDAAEKRHPNNQPNMMAYLTELVFRRVARKGHDPESVINEWRRHSK
jgi:hypothetical protein